MPEGNSGGETKRGRISSVRAFNFPPRTGVETSNPSGSLHIDQTAMPPVDGIGTAFSGDGEICCGHLQTDGELRELHRPGSAVAVLVEIQRP